jgi:hypothetical protein
MQVVAAKKAELGTVLPDTLEIMTMLRMTYQNQGLYQEAEKLGIK